MAVATTAPAVAAEPPAVPEVRAARSRWSLNWLWDVGVALLCLATAYWVTSGLWENPYRRSLSFNEGDHAFFEWLLGYGVQILRNGANPFHTDLLNAPVGVNLAANTSITVLAVLFAPLTMLAGAQISYVTILTLNLAVSAYGWYFLLHAHAVRHRSAAAIGGLFCGFAPGWIAHANGHLNWTAGWLAPAILWWVLKLRASRRWLRDGIVLGVLMAAGFTIAAEMLFSIALATAIFVIAWSAGRATWPQARAAAPTTLAALGVSALVAGALLAYPLYMHFAGPGSFSGTGFDQRRFVEDAAGYLVYPLQSLAGLAGIERGDLASNQTEAASFFGAPLLILIVVGTALLWWSGDRRRRALMRALTIVGLLFTVLSLGPRFNWFNKEYDFPLPYAALAHLPIFDSALPARMALVVACVIGTTLALLADRVLTPRLRLRWRVTWAVAFAAALVPIFPRPLLTSERSPEPRFIADGSWERYVPEGGVMSALPYAASSTPDAQRWQAYTMARGGPQFGMPDGYFLGPGGPDGTGRVGAPERRTDMMWRHIAVTGYAYDIDNYDRAKVRGDLAYWKIDALFIPDRISGKDGILFRAALVHTMEELFGPGERVEDVLVWRVRPGIDPMPVPDDGPDGPRRPTD
ncbi:DUF2079 domain-containing protein [Couchioplanes caeruleus]|uniref:DUF2079 domain-containing protein n=1 Tax=Couchioplanes caeruleus TaxID=56438 RepID=UPI0020C00413|nr:DUF2079 domain-containing protein [Couchioplanes caeruleus]UQU63293.1 DUF2079 domain-containing protein [Couchioplanes caeruleus]